MACSKEAFTALLLSSGVTALAIYRLLPAIACALSRPLLEAGGVAQGDLKQKPSGPLANQLQLLLSRHRDRLARAGWPSVRAHRFFLLFYVCLAAGGLMIGLFLRQPLLALGLPMFGISQVNLFVTRCASQRQARFSRHVYKIYRFIHEQVSSGISLSDALKGLPQVVRDPLVQPILVRFSALYELTHDIEQAFGVLEHAFGAADTRVLTGQIRQCLQSGISGQTLSRMEQLLFTRTYARMQEETERIRSRLTWIAALALLLWLVVFLVPLFAEVIHTTQTVFH